ncbi:amino acids transporter [Penaeus vannamei]|uniref:Amino acids transporter n=1 Tax=Penaeus vannamei TaxID=6689 RepID=A0A423U601_PENVA|nr:amino acids transporter [Penaeus vannamei]
MYCYLHEAFGAVPAFLYMWVTTVIRNSAGAAIVALTFANYLLQPLFPDCEAVSDAATRLIAASSSVSLSAPPCCLLPSFLPVPVEKNSCFLSWINCVNVRWVAKVQNVFMVTKLLALVMIIVAGLYHLASGHVENFRAPMEGTKWQAAAIATAFYQSLFSYSGWNLPLAIIISTGLVTAVYTLTNVAYLAVLTPSEMLAADAVAMSFASRALSTLAWTMPLFVMCSTFGSMNGVVFTQSRLIFVGARRALPEAFLARARTTQQCTARESSS